MGDEYIWLLIKNACELDHEAAEKLIKKREDLTMPQNSLTLIVDEEEVYYRVPICVINDPVKYEVDSATDQLKNR